MRAAGHAIQGTSRDDDQVTEAEKRAALSSLAYRSVLLTAATTRAVTMAQKWAERKRRHEGVVHSVVDTGYFTTSSTMASSWSIFSPEERRDLLEYRAYVELALVLARLLSDVVSRTESRYSDDVLAGELVGNSEFTLAGLPDSLRRRINKGSAAHLVNYADPDGREWQLPQISEWATRTIAEFERELATAAPALAEWFAEEKRRFEAEMVV